MSPLFRRPRNLLLSLVLLSAPLIQAADPVAVEKRAWISAETPNPSRFAAQGSTILDRSRDDAPLFLRGIGYSPYLQGETPLLGDAPPDDGRYAEHFGRFRELAVNYLHLFPQKMPAGFKIR